MSMLAARISLSTVKGVDRCAAFAGATVSVVFDGWNTFVSCTGSWPSSATKSSTPMSTASPIRTWWPRPSSL
jgi:hypothetical protein